MVDVDLEAHGHIVGVLDRAVLCEDGRTDCRIGAGRVPRDRRRIPREICAGHDLPRIVCVDAQFQLVYFSVKLCLYRGRFALGQLNRTCVAEPDAVDIVDGIVFVTAASRKPQSQQH